MMPHLLGSVHVCSAYYLSTLGVCQAAAFERLAWVLASLFCISRWEWAGLWRPGAPLLWGLNESHVHVFVADVVLSFDTVDRGVLDFVLGAS